MITSVVGTGIGRWTHLDSDFGTRTSSHGPDVLRHDEWCTFACTKLSIFMCTPTERSYAFPEIVRNKVGRHVGELPGALSDAGRDAGVDATGVSGRSGSAPATVARFDVLAERLVERLPVVVDHDIVRFGLRGGCVQPDDEVGERDDT